MGQTWGSLEAVGATSPRSIKTQKQCCCQGPPTAETVKSWSHTAPEHQGCMIRKLVTKTSGGDSQVLESHSTRAPRLHDPKTDNKINGGNSQVLESHSTRAPRLDDPKTDTKS